ncbi:CarD family transcriptional regulator [Fonticella tunisiensis]|uniref:CarD family transcriptional regulator n=1 Tax=Fonticella tunisiensis TaxID=1096341 RepID=A0A4R7KA66_9CLOT|nr:CarD family transcriptional regulator [Fonticella tunisiensis]TDT51254.1 CarD family transcriptional regulator [Fonticella tunisiensis]
MFSIGDIIFYPVFGAGYILNIEEKEICGEIKKYYIMKFLLNDMNMMIPIESVVGRRIRRAISPDECEKVLNIIKSNPVKLSSKWSKRCKHYTQSIRSGDIFLLASIIRDIAGLYRTRSLSKSEAKVFMDIVDMVAGEISLVTNRDLNSVKKEILNKVNMNEFLC